jgi:hypothetical protein
MSHPEAGDFKEERYGSDEVCTFKAKQSHLLHVIHFDTQERLDFLIVGSFWYSGNLGPGSLLCLSS